MNRCPWFLAAALVGAMNLVSSLASAGEPLIVSGHPDYPPIMWEENGKIVGVAAEVAKTICDELKVPCEMKAAGPWARVQASAKSGSVDVIAAAYVNAERRTYMDYTVSLMKDPVAIFVWNGKTFPFEKKEDLLGKQGTTNAGESYEEEFDKYAEQKLKIDRVPETSINFVKLEKGRADYFVFGLYPGLANAAAMGYEGKVEALPHYVVSADFYMTFSKKSKYLNLLPQANKIIERMKSDGSIDKLIKKYIEVYKTSHKKK